ncbi:MULTISPECIES: rhodanese-like domain-containing protein [Actinokineospora]|uniref:Sulfurtransferase n=1 Tax=Actinokineospora fastidiosa TaxID=1816 RepID=A0A918GI10_9PSEU|nr:MULTISPECIES: rhodanese-like domain-containing protein [Actinokineospora]UVS80803.1 molybdopterin biosynthesis protein MoeB [Actinokineospora sp. UTMC 2448]GGS37292.1 sulfurtransferase [Actinokineospora fastidiosa]
MVRLIDREDLRAAIDDGEVSVVDTLSRMSWAARRLPGAVHLPPSDVRADVVSSLLPDRGRMVVTYCSNHGCTASLRVAEALESLGYTNVHRYRPGLSDWIAAGLPFESSP